MRKNSPILIALAMIMIFVLWAGLSWLKFFYYPVVTEPAGVKYTVKAGASIQSVVDELYKEEIIDHPVYFMMLVKYKHAAHHLKSGEYLFPKGATAPNILHQLITGTGMIYYKFTLVPGWTFSNVKTAMRNDPYFHHTIENMDDRMLMMQVGADPAILPEGNFFPDTYFFTRDSLDITVLHRAYKAMQEKLNKAWLSREANLPFKTPYEALIAASIIEKEAYYPTELPRIAGVLVNRLKKNMILQFDPTIIYGLGNQYVGKIRRSDLIKDTPYNTYVHKGLPPTPIGMPGMAAITAVLHPEHHDYYYFVAKSDKSHQFSKGLSEHQNAVKEQKQSG